MRCSQKGVQHLEYEGETGLHIMRVPDGSGSKRLLPDLQQLHIILVCSAHLCFCHRVHVLCLPRARLVHALTITLVQVPGLATN